MLSFFFHLETKGKRDRGEEHALKHILLYNISVESYNATSYAVTVSRHSFSISAV